MPTYDHPRAERRTGLRLDKGAFLWDQRPWQAARAQAIVGNPELR